MDHDRRHVLGVCGAVRAGLRVCDGVRARDEGPRHGGDCATVSARWPAEDGSERSPIYVTTTESVNVVQPIF